ncbi:MAG: hypothetical protein ACODAB_02950 [Gemmatimonadota bacterium]
MSDRTWRVLEILVGPVPATVLFVPPMLAGILALSRVAGEGDGGPGLPVVLGLLVAGMAGIVALWVAVLRGNRLEADSRPVRAAVGAGLLLGLVAVVRAAPAFLAPCPSPIDCPALWLGFGGPTIVGIRYVILLIRAAPWGPDPVK